MDAHDKPERRGKGRPPADLKGSKFGFLIPIMRERRGGVTWWKCHCLGKSEGAFNCKQDKQDVWVRHGNLVAGLHKSCGCMKYIRESRTGINLRMRKTKATAADYHKLGKPLPSWIAGSDEFTDDDLDVMIASYRDTD